MNQPYIGIHIPMYMYIGIGIHMSTCIGIGIHMYIGIHMSLLGSHRALV